MCILSQILSKEEEETKSSVGREVDAAEEGGASGQDAEEDI